MDAIKMVGPHEEQEEELNDLSLLQRASRFSSNASLCGDLETTSSYFQYEQELALVALAIAVVSCSLDIQKMTQLEMTAETTAKYVFVILPNHGMTQVLPRTTAHKKKRSQAPGALNAGNAKTRHWRKENLEKSTRQLPASQLKYTFSLIQNDCKTRSRL